jgi:hypothetical protein
MIKLFFIIIGKILFFFQNIFIFFKILKQKQKNISRFAYVIKIFSLVIVYILKIHVWLYLKVLIVIFNLLIVWPISFIKIFWKSISIYLKLIIFFFFFINFFLYCCYFSSLNAIFQFIIFIASYLNLNIDKENVKVLADFGMDADYQMYLDFVQSNSFFLRNLELEKTFYVYYDFSDKYEEKNFFFHKAFFSEYFHWKYLANTTNHVDWHHYEFKYARGWLNNKEILELLNDWEFIKIIAILKDIFIFSVLKFSLSDVFFIDLKYFILDNYILTETFNKDFELFIFKFFILFFPDNFLLNMGFIYKYFFIVLFEYIYEHFLSFFFKLYKIWNLGPGNYALKKKLMLLSTDTFRPPYRFDFLNDLNLPNININPYRIKPELLNVYPFLLQIDDTSFDNLRTTFLGLYDRNVCGSVIETSPIISERYDIVSQTGLSNPRSYMFYIGEDDMIILKPSYHLSEWDDWDDLNLNGDFFDKSLYFKNAKSFFPGENQANDDFFFGADKVFLSKDLPREIGWYFKGPFSFSATNILYTSAVSTVNSASPLKLDRIANINVNPFINTNVRFFFRNWSPHGVNIFPQFYNKIKRPILFEDMPLLRRKSIFKGYNYKKNLKNFLFDEIVEISDYTDGSYKALVAAYILSPFRYHNFSSLSAKGDFSFGNDNYIYVVPFRAKKLLFNAHNDKFTAYHSRGLSMVVASNLAFNDTLYDYTFLKFNPLDLGYYENVINDFVDRNDRDRYMKWKKKRMVSKKRKFKFKRIISDFYPGFFPFNGFPPLGSNQMYFKNYELKDTSYGSNDFYDFWVNSLINSSFISLEMGKLKLQTENLVPVVGYKKHIEQAYNLRFSTVFLFLSYFLKVFFYSHLIVFKILWFLLMNLKISYFLYLFFFFVFMRALYFFYIIDIKNMFKVAYNIFNLNGFLYEKKKFFSFFDFVTFESWTFSSFYKDFVLRYFVKNILKVFFFFFLKRIKESFLELTFFILECCLSFTRRILNFFLKKFDFFFFKLFIWVTTVKYLIFKKLKSIIDFLFLLFMFAKETIRNKGALFLYLYIFFFVNYIIFSLFIRFLIFFFKIIFFIFLFFIYLYILEFFNFFFNIDLAFSFPTYIMLLIVFFFIFIFTSFSKVFKKNLVYSDLDFLNSYSPEDDIDEVEEMEEALDEDDDEIGEEEYESEFDETSFYDEPSLYSNTFHDYKFLMLTTEGVVSTDIVRPNTYFADIRFLRKYYGKLKRVNRKFENKKHQKGIPVELLLNKNDDSLYVTAYNFFLIMKKALEQQKPIYHVRFLKPFYMFFDDPEFHLDYYLFFSLAYKDFSIIEEALPKHLFEIVKNHFLKIYLAYSSYNFEEEYEFAKDTLEPGYNIFELQNIKLGSQFENDHKLLKAKIAQRELYDVDEEEFFEKEFWLDQFFYKRVYEIDLTDFNPIIFNKQRKNNQLYYYSNMRLDYLDFDILNNNSFKFLYYFYSSYSTKSRVYTRIGENLPYIQRFAESYYRFLPELSHEVNIDYDLGLNVSEEGYSSFYKNAYIGFQLRESFFGATQQTSEYFIKIINPYECMDNKLKLNFFSNLNYYISLLNLKNFPNLTKKEFERILFFFNCTEEQWDELSIGDDEIEKKDSLEVFDYTEFPVFIFISFLFYLQSNNYMFFWDYNTESKGEGEDYEIEDEIIDEFLNSLEPTMFSTKFIHWLLELPFLILDNLAFFFYEMCFDIEDKQEQSYIFVSYIRAYFFNYFELSSLINFLDFIILSEIFLMRSLDGFFFYDMCFIIINLTLTCFFYLFSFFFEFIMCIL